MAFDFHGSQFLIGDFGLKWINSFVEFGFDAQSLIGAGVSDQIDDYLMADQRTTTPILGYVAEHPMFDLVPFAGARWKVTNMNRHVQPCRKILHATFHKRQRLLLLPPPSAVMSNSLVVRCRFDPVFFHQRRIASTANLAVS